MDVTVKAQDGIVLHVKMDGASSMQRSTLQPRGESASSDRLPLLGSFLLSVKGGSSYEDCKSCGNSWFGDKQLLA